MSSEDMVNSPSHYSLKEIEETIDLIRRELTAEEFRGHCKGNVIKYVTRASGKNGDEDWKKAKVYMNWLEL